MTARPALTGLRVVDFGQYIAGPLAAMQLADHGADVIRIDPPGGPRWKGPSNALWNRGKRSIVLDLKQPGDLQVARRLVACADVVIENFRPGVMRRLGLDAAQLTRENPHLVWCSLPGFAADDARAQVPAWEGVLGATSGQYTLNVQKLRTDGGRRTLAPDDGRPIYTATPTASVFAGCMGAMAIAMALVARQRDGRGQHIEVPLHDAAYAAIGSPRWKGLPGTPWVRSYQCADGRWVDLLCYHAKHVTAFVRGAGVEDWLGQPFMNDINKVFRVDPAKATELLGRMERLMLTRTAADWEERMAQAGVPLAMVRTSREWMHLPQARDSGCIVERGDPALGRLLQPGIQVQLSASPGVLGRPAPQPDAHRGEILAELETLQPRTLPLSDTPDTRPPLAGLRMVDFGSVLVGPACGRTLAEYGAEVIKVDDPAGVGANPDVNRGKRSLFLDLDKPGAGEVLAKLVEECDICLQNFRLGVAERLGLGEAQVRERNPGAIYVTYSLYGRDGSWAGRPGYENQAQAATGMMERFGDGSPALEPCPVNDYGTALTGSFGVALAIYRRNALKQAQGLWQGQHVSTGLVFTASLLQGVVMNDFEGKAWNEPRGQHQLGSGPLHRCYRAADGWMFLAARDDRIGALDRVAGLEGLASSPRDGLEAELERRLATATVAQWASRLAPVDVAVQALVAIPEVMRAPRALARGIVLDRPHPDGGRSITIGPIAQLSHTPLVPGRPLRASAEGPEIVQALGMGDRLDALLSSGAVVVVPPVPAD